MNTDQLKSFIQVAENLNFARAAEILKITQSAVSRQIHALEDELGTKLLHRTTRTVTLTPAGISFLEDAKNVIGRLKIAEQKLQRHQSTNLQVLTIGCQSEANLDLLFGFQDDIPIKNDTVYKELFWIPLCCIVPAAHPYAARPELAKEELYLENIVVCNSYAIPAKVAEMQNQISQHILPESTYVCENLQVLLTLVRAGYGCSVLPQMNFINSDICSVPLKNSEPLSYGLFIKKFTKSFAKKIYFYCNEHISPLTFTAKSDMDTRKHPYRFLFDIQNVCLSVVHPITLRLRYHWIFQGLLPSCSSEPAVSKCHPQNVP